MEDQHLIVAQLVQTLDHPVLVASTEGEVLGASRPAARLLGWTEPLCEKRPLRDVMGDESAKIICQATETLKAKGAPQDVAFAAPGGGHGRRIHASVAGIVVRGEMVAVSLQLMDREAAATKTAASPSPDESPINRPEILHAAAQDAGFAQWVTYPDRREMWVTKAYFELLGFAPGEVEIDGKWVRERIHPDDLPFASEQIGRLCEGKSDRYEVDYRLRCKDGTYKWFEASARQYPVTDDRFPALICGSLADISERKANEARLLDALQAAETALSVAEKSERLLHVATEHAGVAPWYLDPATGVFTRNEKFGTITGRKDQESDKSLTGMLSLIHPDDLPRVQAELSAMISGQKAEARVDHRLRHVDGHWVWCTSVAKPFRREDEGAHPLICGTTFDITERKDYEHRLAAAADAARRAQERFNRLADNMPGAVFEWQEQPDGRAAFPYFSARMPELFGTTAQALKADWHAAFTLMEPGDRLNLTDKIAEATAALTAFDTKVRVLHPESGTAWVRISALPFAQADGSVIWYGNVSDITEQMTNQQRAVEAADRSRLLEERLRLATGAAKIGIWDLDFVSGRNVWDETMHSLYGVPVGSFEGDYEGWRNRIHPDDVKRSEDQFKAAVASGEDYDTEFRIVIPAGDTRVMRARARVFVDDMGKPLRALGVNYDVTDQKAAERRMAEAAEELRLAHTRLNTLTDNSATALFEYRVSADGKIDCPYFSARLPEISGVPAEDIAADGSAFERYVHPDDLPRIHETLERAGRTLSPVTFKHRMNHPTEGERWVMSSVTPCAQPDGAIVFYSSILDITDQMVAEQRVAETAEALKRAHDRLTLVADVAPAGLYEFRRAHDGRFDFPYCSGRFVDLVGIDAARIESDPQSVFDAVLPEDLPEVMAKTEESARTLGLWNIRFRMSHPERGTLWLSGTAVPRSEDNGDIVWTGALLDVTEDVAREEELHRAHDRLTSMANIAPVGLYEFGANADGALDFPYTSKRFEDLVGYSRAEIDALKDGIFARVHPEDRPKLVESTEESMRNVAPWNMRFRICHPERGEIWMAAASIPRSDPDGNVVWTGALHDVTKDVEREAELKRAYATAEQMRTENERQALHDGLTGLPNRRFYDRILADRISGAENGGPKGCALIRIDLDHFKYVNDTLGHEAGDKVLVRVADVLRSCLRAGDFGARIGGDEFSILLTPGNSETDAGKLVERIRIKLAEPLIHEGRQCRFGASFGIAWTEDISTMSDDIQLFADAALYRAKAGGRNRLELFTPELHRQILHDRRMAVEIHEALDNDQFVPFFQPQISAADGSLVGIETLLRWNHPTDGVVAPDAFLRVADHLHLVPEIDRIMMEKSRDILARWRRQGFSVPKISFNVSSGRMHDPDVVSLARDMVADGTKVTFELLESILVEEESDAFRFHLEKIREVGVDIEIDDFGSGHASIISLMEISPSALKIDKRIVLPVEDDLRARNLVRAIVEIAETMGIGTVAEGVETEAQAQILRGIGCGVLQGYLFARPLSEAQFLEYVTDATRRSA
ncbi:diguanylate cyclase/phosphodiesterase (GGDEF & EAL domains) with PAS/PAC sensor(s) [Rhodovulum sp. P5]|uniref:PAS domain-containing protein n=1 Tax=Rhodovulum sp. P5 TaxID=1564506 RepID=UPI0009C36589|nr:PAS domain-containing protein [Rhodovulum sp. P5]ARE41355.1 diguanylate cyclase/phosphodiesterase (GGDEF & EAL domains) with PAS/PAC sensor(s) [Rhodovulum sp. P5]